MFYHAKNHWRALQQLTAFLLLNKSESETIPANALHAQHDLTTNDISKPALTSTKTATLMQSK